MRTFTISLLIVLGAAWVTGCGSGKSAASSSATGSPAAAKSTVVALQHAIEAADPSQACRYVAPAFWRSVESYATRGTSGTCLEVAKEAFALPGPFKAQTAAATIQSATIGTDGRAAVRFTTGYVLYGPQYEQSGSDAKPWQLALVRAGDRWLVDGACSLRANGQDGLCIGSSSPATSGSPPEQRSAALVPRGAACAVDPSPIGKLLGAGLTPVGSESAGNDGSLLYCYYTMSTPPDASLRIGLLRCSDVSNFFDTSVHGTATAAQFGGTAGRVKYDESLNAPSGTAVAIAGGLGARADIQTPSDPHGPPPFSFDASTTLPAVAKMALLTYLTTAHGQAAPGASC
jgi:hypothetical protein